MTILRFLRETRAGATAIAAVTLTVMTMGGVALVTDHVWLTHQRDLLKHAADAAVTAATIRLQEFPASMSDDDVESRLKTLVKRYVRLNLAGSVPEEARAQMEETLKVEVNSDRTLGTVAVAASADLGGTLLSKRILAYAGPQDGITVKAGAEGSIGVTELVLAIDVTWSMTRNLDGVRVGASDPTSRLSIVKKAAEDLIDILAAHQDSTVAVGIVPWTYRVRLNQAARSQWETDGWAVYPAERTYPHPTRGPPGSDMYLPERQAMPARDRLDSCGSWAGCLDMRVDSALRPSFSTTLPSAEPFLMNFFTDQTTYPEHQYVSYACQAYARGVESPLCYDLDSVPTGQNHCWSGRIQPGGPRRIRPQAECSEPEVMPLNTDLAAIRTAVSGLQPTRQTSYGGAATYSSAGIAWAIRLLTPSWREVWGHSIHPMDGDIDGIQKVIVLLTDGEDNHLSDAQDHRRQGCTAAKDDGILVFTIAAMHPSRVGDTLAQELQRCSSQADDPGGTYFFVNNATPDALRDAFADIGRQMITLRRTY